MENKKQKKGFTLVELLIAISIFMGFLLVVTNAFIEIVRAQKTANETRLIYSELRGFVDYVNNELREGGIDYFCYNQGFLEDLDFTATSLVRCNGDSSILTIDSNNNLRSISKDGLTSSIIKFEDGKVCLTRFRNINGSWEMESGYSGGSECQGNYKEFAFANLKVNDLRLEIYPKKDPNSADGKKALANQIQPMVRMYLDVGSKLETVQFNLKYQTLITARN